MNICYLLAAPLYRWRYRHDVPAEKNVFQSPAAYWKWQFDSSGIYFGKFSDLHQQLKGKRVLDIGCGLGGRTSYLATLDVKEVVGIDINEAEIEQARRLAKETLSPDAFSKVRFELVKEGSVPEPGLFDVALLVDSLEHVQDPVVMLNVAFSHLRIGGVCYFGTVGWYHYNAAHLITLLPVPFVTVFFSDKTILDAVRRIMSAPWYVPTMWDSSPPVLRWEGVEDLRERPGEYLNKISIRGIRQAMKKSQFGGGTLEVAGFSWRGRPWLRWLNVLARIPGIQEAYHSGCFGRMVRRGTVGEVKSDE